MSWDFSFVELTFENLDWIRIPVCYLSEFKTEAMESGEYAVMIVLKQGANVEAGDFEGDIHSIQFEHGSLFERLCGNDITQIMLVDSNSTGKRLQVVWEDSVDNEFVNRFQTTSIVGDGVLTLHIGRESLS